MNLGVGDNILRKTQTLWFSHIHYSHKRVFFSKNITAIAQFFF